MVSSSPTLFCCLPTASSSSSSWLGFLPTGLLFSPAPPSPGLPGWHALPHLSWVTNSPAIIHCTFSHYYFYKGSTTVQSLLQPLLGSRHLTRPVWSPPPPPCSAASPWRPPPFPGGWASCPTAYYSPQHLPGSPSCQALPHLPWVMTAACSHLSENSPALHQIWNYLPDRPVWSPPHQPCSAGSPRRPPPILAGWASCPPACSSPQHLPGSPSCHTLPHLPWVMTPACSHLS